MKFLSDGHVVGCRVFKRFEGQRLTEFQSHVGRVVGRAKCFNHVLIPFGVGGDEDMTMIFGGSSHHGRPADVDHFEEIIVVQRRRGGGGVPERVEVASHDANGGVN